MSYLRSSLVEYDLYVEDLSKLLVKKGGGSVNKHGTANYCIENEIQKLNTRRQYCTRHKLAEIMLYFLMISSIPLNSLLFFLLHVKEALLKH